MNWQEYLGLIKGSAVPTTTLAIESDCPQRTYAEYAKPASADTATARRTQGPSDAYAEYAKLPQAVQERETPPNDEEPQPSTTQHLSSTTRVFTLKHHPVEFDMPSGETALLVADEEDAALVAEPRGMVWTTKELAHVSQIPDEADRLEIYRWKWAMNGRVREFQDRRS